VSAVDLLAPTVGELAGGSLRENDLATLQSRTRELDKGNGGLEKSLDWYFDLRRWGSVPTGGFGLGYDRLLQLVLGCGNIKDVTAFPRWPHHCPM
jgi:asparaginyl-tRNA synthetase